MHRLFPFSIAASALALTSLSQGQVVITEIMYHPLSIDLNRDTEFIEIYNNSDDPVDLEGWRLLHQDYLLRLESDPAAAQLEAPPAFSSDVFYGGRLNGSSILMPGEIAVIFNGGTRTEEDFRYRWNISDSVKLIAPDWGQKFDMVANPTGAYYPDTNTLSSSSSQPEYIILAKKDGPTLGDVEVVDLVDYRNGFSSGGGWPDAGANNAAKGGSIYLKTASLLTGNAAINNNSGYNWALSVSGVEGAVTHNGDGNFLYKSDVGSPGRIWGIDAPIPEPGGPEPFHWTLGSYRFAPASLRNLRASLSQPLSKFFGGRFFF